MKKATATYASKHAQDLYNGLVCDLKENMLALSKDIARDNDLHLDAMSNVAKQLVDDLTHDELSIVSGHYTEFMEIGHVPDFGTFDTTDQIVRFNLAQTLIEEM